MVIQYQKLAQQTNHRSLNDNTSDCKV